MDMDGNTATGGSAQDISTRLESVLYDSEQEKEPEVADDEVVSEDAEKLPEDDDTDSDEDDGSTDLEDMASEEDLTLAGYLGLDDEKLDTTEDGEVVYNAIIDGETKQVPFKDVVASYQLQGHVNNKSMALESERKEFEEQKSLVEGELSKRVEGVGHLSQALEQQLVSEYNSIDWDKLRVENSSEWTALRQEYAEKAQSIQNIQGLIGEEQKRIQDEEQKSFIANQQKHLKEEMDKMISSNPEWSDPKVLDRDMGELRSFASSSYGFTDQDLSSVSDHRIIKVLQDAKAYRDGSKAAVTKKMKNVPKFQKPGATKGNAAALSKARDAKSRKAAVKKTGHINDVAKLLVDRM